jgi:hypothetical protein
MALLDRAQWAGKNTPSLMTFKPSWGEAVSALVVWALMYRYLPTPQEQWQQALQAAAQIFVAILVIPGLHVLVQMFRAPSIRLQRENADLLEKASRLTAIEAELNDLRGRQLRDLDWNRAIETFRGLPTEIVADFTEASDGTRQWSLRPLGTMAQHAHVRACEGACKLAAHTLLQSKAGTTLPSEIQNETDGLSLWLSYVALHDGFEDVIVSGADYRQEPPLTATTRSIRDVPQASKRLCELCRNSEGYL